MSDFHPGYILERGRLRGSRDHHFQLRVRRHRQDDAVRSLEGDLRTAQYSARDHGGRDVDRGVHHHRGGGALELCLSYFSFRYS